MSLVVDWEVCFNLRGLEQRHLKEYNDFSYVEKTNVDFERVNFILNQERAKGVAFLKNALRNE